MKQGPQKPFVQETIGRRAKDFTEWRAIDYESILNHRDRMIQWIDEYRGERRVEKPKVVSQPQTWSPAVDPMKLKGYLERTVELIVTLYHEDGVWQKPWPDLTRQVSLALRSHSWGKKLLDWPVGDTLSGVGTRDLERVGALLQGLEAKVVASAVMYAPRKWMSSDEATRSQFYQNQQKEACHAQIEQFKTWTPEEGVQPFDRVKAAGVPGHWNFIQPQEYKGKNQEFTPMVTYAEPNHADIDRWLDSRVNSEGNTLRSQFDAPIVHKDGWLEYRNSSYDESKLPKKSLGPFAYENNGKPVWNDYYHGIKVEAAYAVLSDWNKRKAGLIASSDKDQGQRYNLLKKGVYFHERKHLDSCFSYARWSPLLGDGTYVRMYVQVKVDRNYRVSYKHPNQKVQIANCDCTPEQISSDLDESMGGPSIFPQALWIQHVGYQNIKAQEPFSYVWNPAFEARPWHIKEKYGDNQDELVSVIVMPPSVIGHSEEQENQQDVLSVGQASVCAADVSLPDPEVRPVQAEVAVPMVSEKIIRFSLDSEDDASGNEAQAERVAENEIPPEGVKMALVNQAVAVQEAASIVGIEGMRLPAHLPETPERDFDTPWGDLLNDYAKRFHPDIVDREVLEKTRGFLPKETIDTYAVPSLRKKWMPDPMAGLPQSTKEVARYGAHAQPLGPVHDQDFQTYLNEFVTMANDLREKRQQWVDIARWDDPLNYDESRVRILEADVMTSLVKMGANDLTLREVHCIPSRLRKKTIVCLENGKVDPRPMFSDTITSLVQLKKAYLRSCAAMRRDPSADILAQIGILSEVTGSVRDQAVVEHGGFKHGVRLMTVGRNFDANGGREPASQFPMHLSAEHFFENKDSTGFPKLYEGTPGKKVTIYLQRKDDEAVDDLPELDSEQILEIMSVTLLLPSVMNEISYVTDMSLVSDLNQMEPGVGELDGDDSTPVYRFEFHCDTGKNAHFAGRRLCSYELQTRSGTKYVLAGTRTLTDAEIADRELRNRPAAQGDVSCEMPGEAVISRVPDEARGKGEKKVDNKRAISFADHDTTWDNDEELLVCSQCRVMADPQYKNAKLRSWAQDAEEGTFGVRNDRDGQLFCNISCLRKHLNGESPLPMPKEVQDYMDSRLESDKRNLLLLQAHYFQERLDRKDLEEVEAALAKRKRGRGQDYVAPEDRKQSYYRGEAAAGFMGPEEIEECARRSARAAGGMLLTVKSAILQQYLEYAREAKDGVEVPPPPEAIARARTLTAHVNAEVKAELRSVDPKDPDRLYKLYRIKLCAVLASRDRQDKTLGYDRTERHKRRHNRIRVAMKYAVKSGAVPEKVNVEQKKERAPNYAEVKKREDLRRKRNYGDKVKKLKIVGSLCKWFANHAHEYHSSNVLSQRKLEDWKALSMEQKEVRRPEFQLLFAGWIKAKLPSEVEYSVGMCFCITGPDQHPLGEFPCRRAFKHPPSLTCDSSAGDEIFGLRNPIGLLFTPEECFDHAMSVEDYNVTRAREVHEWFLKVYPWPWVNDSRREARTWTDANTLLDIFLKKPSEKGTPATKAPAVNPQSGPKPPEDDPDEENDWGDSQYRRMRVQNDSYYSRTKTRDEGQGSSQGRSSSSWQRRSMSGAWEDSDRSRSVGRRGSALRTSPCLAARMTVFALLPTLVNAMDVVHAAGAPGAALSSIGLICSAAWYLAGTSVSISAVTAVPVIIDAATTGVEELIYEAVSGSKMIFRCVSIGLVCIASIAIVMTGYRVLTVLSNRLSVRRAPLDQYEQRYGGRLIGGGKYGPGLSAKEVFRPLEGAEPERVDLDRVGVGDEFSFIYERGGRAGLRRTVTLQEIITTTTGSKLRCLEKNQKGEVFERKYWAHMTYEPRYKNDVHTNISELAGFEEENFSTPTGELDSVCAADTALPTLSEGGEGAVATLSVVNRAKAALGYSTEEWKAKRVELHKTQFFTGQDISSVVLGELTQMKTSIDGLQYQIDHTQCVVRLVAKLSQGLQGRLLLDKSNFQYSSCARQALRVQELWEAGCQLKVLKPKGSNFACMHVKTLIFDRKTLLTGSVNMTHNGFENNKEHLYRIPDPHTVAEVLEDFETVWSAAEVVTQDMIDYMLKKHEERKANPRSRSESVSRGVSRSLASELEEVDEPR